MIKNERQYRITKAQADRFERGLAQMAESPTEGAQIDPILNKAMEDAMRSQLSSLRTELREYEALRSGEYSVLELTSFDELPRALIQARIASGLSQKALAERLGLKEQQIQRYEATEYTSASMERLKEVIRALGIHVREDVFLPSADVSLANLFRRLSEVGLDRDFLTARLIPRSITASLPTRGGAKEEVTANLALQAASAVGRVFGLAPAAIFGSSLLELNTAAVGAARFKTAERTNERRLNAYTVYAHYLALLTLEATSDLSKKPIPREADEVWKDVLATYGSITFDHLLRYVWSLGVPVLPLNDSGAFHGAYWRVQGRHVIVLKQRTRLASRWLFDLLHELLHSGQEPDLAERTVIEPDVMTKEWRESSEEEVAMRFAGDVLLAGRAEDLAKLCVRAANGKLQRLKSAVQQIAERERVPLGALANYMAYRLSRQGENWWGPATNLQVDEEDPWETARDLFLKKANFGRLNEVDRNLLLQALTEREA